MVIMVEGLRTWDKKEGGIEIAHESKSNSSAEG